MGYVELLMKNPNRARVPTLQIRDLDKELYARLKSEAKSYRLPIGLLLNEVLANRYTDTNSKASVEEQQDVDDNLYREYIEVVDDD